MSYTETITCRIAIQVCIGYSPSGRARRRTFSMKGVRPDAPDEAIAAVVRALAPVLAYPVTKVRKVVKRTIVFDEWKSPAAPAAALAAPVPAPEVSVWEEPVAAPEPDEKNALAAVALLCLAWILSRSVWEASASTRHCLYARKTCGKAGFG